MINLDSIPKEISFNFKSKVKIFSSAKAEKICPLKMFFDKYLGMYSKKENQVQKARENSGLKTTNHQRNR